jgi:hypothetical protein
VPTTKSVPVNQIFLTHYTLIFSFLSGFLRRPQKFPSSVFQSFSISQLVWCLQSKFKNQLEYFWVELGMYSYFHHIGCIHIFIILAIYQKVVAHVLGLTWILSYSFLIEILCSKAYILIFAIFSFLLTIKM